MMRTEPTKYTSDNKYSKRLMELYEARDKVKGRAA